MFNLANRVLIMGQCFSEHLVRLFLLVCRKIIFTGIREISDGRLQGNLFPATMGILSL
jgi:hypothetical protein